MLLFVGSIFPISIQAQSIASDVVGSAGNFVVTQKGSMAWTLGEVTIETLSSNHFLTQGFHQPSSEIVVVKENPFFIPEGFSPNDDGINDLFVIRGVDQYPNNTIIIFNRWGNEVYNAKSYKNTWNGKSSSNLTVGGDALPVGTYFYVFDFGTNKEIVKGTIYLNR